MYNLLLALALALASGGAVMLAGFPLISAILPALLVFPLAMFLLARRTGARIQAELAPLQQLMQEQKVDEARALIIEVRDRWSPWQMLLHGQLTAQLGMLAYLQMKFDEAQPLLEAANGRDWSAATALGCIHYRRGRFDDAWTAFESAMTTGNKELIVYVVWATLLTRKNERSKALDALSRGLEAIPEQPLLRRMKNAVANKQKLDTSWYPDAWYQFFPEDMARQMQMRGRRGQPTFQGQPVAVKHRTGPPQPRQRGKLARRR
jgi:tetratricopeptide (TPR) repeat protein